MSDNNGDVFEQFFANSDPEAHELNVEIRAFMLIYQGWLVDHENEVHDGEYCAEERAGLIAFIAHRIGMTKEAWDLVPEFLAHYKEQHDARHRET